MTQSPYDFETAQYWRGVAIRLRSQATQCVGGEILAKLNAARLADEHAAGFESSLARYTASEASLTHG